MGKEKEIGLITFKTKNETSTFKMRVDLLNGLLYFVESKENLVHKAVNIEDFIDELPILEVKIQGR